MHLKILGLFAAMALVAACAQTPEETSAASGAGAGSATTTSSSASGQSQSAAPKMSLKEKFVVEVGDRVYFDYDKYNLSPDARNILEKQAAWLSKNTQFNIIIEGHCDERGTREYNLALGERRANAVKDYLAALGIPPNRMSTISYGKERPVALGSNEAAWAQNRRGVTEISVGGS